MTLVDIVGKDGHKIRLWEYDNLYFDPDFPENPSVHLSAIRNWNTRSDDIFVCSYPKAGTHWAWEIAAMLLSGQAEQATKIMTSVEHRQLSVFDNMESPRLIISHLNFRYLPRTFVEGKGKIIYILRNPKDIAVSFYNFIKALEQDKYQGSWQSYLELFETGRVHYGKWFEHVKDWERVRKENPEYPIHFVFYEDLQKAGLETLKKMASFLGVSTDNDFLRRVKESCRFRNMKSSKQINMNGANEGVIAIGPGDFFRKGEVGDWKNWFTVAQSERFDELYRKEMETSDLRDLFQF